MTRLLRIQQEASAAEALWSLTQWEGESWRRMRRLSLALVTFCRLSRTHRTTQVTLGRSGGHPGERFLWKGATSPWRAKATATHRECAPLKAPKASCCWRQSTDLEEGMR